MFDDENSHSSRTRFTDYRLRDEQFDHGNEINEKLGLLDSGVTVTADLAYWLLSSISEEKHIQISDVLSVLFPP